MGIIALMTLSLAISIFRVVNAIRFNCTPPAKAGSIAAKPAEDMILNCERIEDALENENKFRIKSILLSE